jgi:hypothetical protein
MSPSRNAIEVAKVLWQDARRKGTRVAWIKAYHQFGGIRLYLFRPTKQQRADYDYICDMQDAALDMMEDQ